MILRSIKRALVIADAQLLDVLPCIPVEWQILDRGIFAVRSLNGGEDGSAVFDSPAHRTELVHAPRQRHRARSRNSTKCGAQTSRTITSGRRHDRAKRFTADAESDEPCHSRGAWSGRRAAGSLI